MFSLENRHPYRIAFPNVAAYRLDPPVHQCRLDPDRVEPFQAVDPQIPTTTTAGGSVGEQLTLHHDRTRAQAIIYALAARALQHFDLPENSTDLPVRRGILFASMLESVRTWLRHQKIRYPGIRVLGKPPNNENAALAIARACVPDRSSPAIRPMFADELDPGQPRLLDTSGVDFRTSLKYRYPPGPEDQCAQSELNAAACHSNGEALLARALDTHPEVLAWARNFRLGWHIPYLNPQRGVWRRYEPDFVARIQSDRGLRHLVIEFKGDTNEDALIKTRATREWWLPAVNGSEDPACGGTWQYVFIDSNESIMAGLEQAVVESNHGGA